MTFRSHGSMEGLILICDLRVIDLPWQMIILGWPLAGGGPTDYIESILMTLDICIGEQ